MASHWFKELWRQQGLGYTALGTVSLIPRSAQVNWPTSISFEQLLDEFVPPAELDKTVLNLGANDGKRHDPSYSLLAHRAYGGIMYEGDRAFRKRLFRNMRSVNTTGRTRINWGFASPSSIGKMMRAGLAELGFARDEAAVLRPDAFKVDIDSFDLPMTRSVLSAGIQPKVIMVEINSDIPPPVQWTVGHNERFLFDFDGTAMRGFFGASMDAWFTSLQKEGYGLVAIELGTEAGGSNEHNAWFVRSELMRAKGVTPPSWRGMTNAFWRQQLAWQPKVAALPGDALPRCHTIGGANYGAGLRTRLDKRPIGPRIPCPLQTLRAAAAAVCPALNRSSLGRWKTWAHMSMVLASPRAARVAQAYAEEMIESVTRVACTTLAFRGVRQDPRICPYTMQLTTKPSLGAGTSQAACAV